jgi:MerR family mercuric resistance operon transcriptional regulator
MPALTISGLAHEAGVNVETIRFYQRRGLLTEPDKPLGGIRRYAQTDVARVLFIKAAQRIGFTLDEIAQLLQLDDGTHCSEARTIAERKLADVRARLADLQRIEAALTQLVGRCKAGRGKISCPLIASLQPAMGHEPE